MKLSINALLVTLLTTLSCAASSKAPVVLKDFEAGYNILRKGDLIGTGSRTLTHLPNGDILYKYHTDLEYFIFSDTREEKSTLTIDNNIVSPKQYIFERTGTGPDKYLQWTFDKKQNSASYRKEKDENDFHEITIDFSKNLQDKLSYHLQQRLSLINNPQQKHFVHPVIQKSGNIKNYVYEYDGEEELTLPYGNIQTVRFKREVVEKKRITYAWFAPELNYLLVRLHQIKDGVEQLEARLNTYTEK